MCFWKKKLKLGLYLIVYSNDVPHYQPKRELIMEELSGYLGRIYTVDISNMKARDIKSYMNGCVQVINMKEQK